MLDYAQEFKKNIKLPCLWGNCLNSRERKVKQDSFCIPDRENVLLHKLSLENINFNYPINRRFRNLPRTQDNV